MTDEIKEVKKEEEAPSASEEEKNDEKKDDKKDSDSQTSQDSPLKKELENIDKSKTTFTKRERLNFEKKKIDEQLGVIDKEEGITPDTEITDTTPVTVGMLDKREREQSKKTALNMAEAIEDEDERKLTIHYLKNRIVPSGNAEADLRFARAAVNSLRNSQIAQEMDRKRDPNEHQSSSGAPATHEKEFTPTIEELVFMKPPYNLKKEDIIKAREEARGNRG